MVALSRAAASAVLTQWRRIDPLNIASSWLSLLPAVQILVERGQRTAADSSTQYLDDLLDEYGMETGGEADVRPQGFAGQASDGRDLRDLLYQPAITTLVAIRAGDKTATALASGLYVTDMIVRTQVTDAGRVADGVALVTRPQLSGWVRMLSLPSCGRCAILAGKHFRWNDGFKRHPACDCRHVPAPEDAFGDVRTRPLAYFNSLKQSEQDRLFGVAEAKAIRDGADIYQVVNAGKGMYEAGVFGRNVRGTTQGTTVRALAGQRLSQVGGASRKEGSRYRSSNVVRLMPEQIYKEAGSDRSEVLRLLRLHGYIL